MSSIILAYITTPNETEALSLGNILVDQKLAACVNIIPGMKSIYIWEGQKEMADEVILIAKTTQEQSQSLLECVQKNHSYTCPCVLFLPIEGGNEKFLFWIQESIKKI